MDLSGGSVSFFSEHFSGERLDGCASLPGIGRQAGLAAGLLEEGDAVPVVFDRNLGQEEAAVSGHADEEAVAPNLDCIGGDGLRDGENAEFDLELPGFLELDRMEARVVKSGGPGGIGYRAIDGADGKNVANASAKLSVEIERGECAARFGEVRGGWIEGNLTMLERGED